MTLSSPSATSSDSLHLPDRILIVRLSAHGDLIHTLPLLTALKKQNPQASIGWLVEASAAPLLAGHPFIDRLHVSQRKRWLKLAQNPLNWPRVFREARQLIAEIRQADYQVSLDVQGLFKSAVWPFLAKIPRRLGYLKSRELSDRFYTEKLPGYDFKDAVTPVVEQFLDFARALNCTVVAPEFAIPPISEASRQKVAGLLAGANPEWPLVALAPFTRWDSKHWLPEYWVQLLTELVQLPVNIVIIGAPGDESATQAMLNPLPEKEAAQRIVNLVGRTDWPDLYALFQRTRLLIGLDSGPLHIANAVGVPEIIGLFGPTAAGRTGPIGPQHTTLTTTLSCQPCHAHQCPIKTHDCMRQLTPLAVMTIVRQHLGLQTAQPDTSDARLAR